MRKSLKEKYIPSVSYYSVPLHLQPVFENLGYKEGDFPSVEKMASQCLSLPMSPYLSVNDQTRVNKLIRLCFVLRFVGYIKPQTKKIKIYNLV